MGTQTFGPLRHILTAIAVFCVILFPSALLPQSYAQTPPDLYALIVGVGKYEVSGHDLPPVQEARELYDFLVSQSGGFNRTHIALLMDEQATKARIMEAVTKGLSKAGKDDVVILYLDGHGWSDPSSKKWYFCPYDTDSTTASFICISDKKLFDHIKSERVLYLGGSCFSGGFEFGMKRGPGGAPYFEFLKDMTGRFGISSSSAGETSTSMGQLGMTVFGFSLMRGLRGAADTTGSGVITVQALYDYVRNYVVEQTKGAQHPALYAKPGSAAATPIYNVPTYSKELKLNVQFLYEDGDSRVKPLTNSSVLKSGQNVAVSFKPEADCYVHILWWDTKGNVGRLFPNPKLTEGDSSGLVKAGQSYELPAQAGKRRWFVLDKNPGTETIYFVASRQRNPKLEKLYEELQAEMAKAKAEGGTELGRSLAQRMEREINFMGFADYVEPSAAAKDQSFQTKEQLVQALDSKVKVLGADAFYQLRFKHE